MLKSADDHFPGDIDVTITHIYDADHQWSIEYEAVASEDTLFSPTNHVYFNLNRDNNVVDNHRISSNQLDMYVLDERNINLYGEKAPSILKAGEVFNSKTSFRIEEKVEND